MLITDSVCLKVIDSNNLLVGVGNQLHYHHTPNGRTARSVFVLENVLRERIHGISAEFAASGQHRIVCHGGREIALFTLDAERLKQVRAATDPKRTLLNDLISSSHMYANGLELALLTAHGVAVRIALDWSPDGEGKQTVVEVAKCPDRSTLYCSRIVEQRKLVATSGWLGTTFFGGTAFGELIVWRCEDKVPKILIRMECHKGVILSIDCNLRAHLISTTSDDRSLKLWRFEDHAKHSPNFTALRPVQTMYGHTARVFSCKIIFVDHAAFVLTASEDQHLCVWKVSTGVLMLRHTMSAALWHLDYEPTNRIVYVSGADGNCKRMPVKHVLDGTKNQCTIMVPAVPPWANPADRVFKVRAHANAPAVPLTNINRIASCHPYMLPIACLLHDTKQELEMALAALPVLAERVSKVSFLANGHLVMVTNQNRVACAHPDTAWVDPQMVPFCVSLLQTHKDWVAVAGSGVVSVYRFDPNRCCLKIYFNVKFMSETIRSLHFLSEETYLLIDENGIATIVNIRGKVTHRFKMLASREPWATAVVQLDQMLVIADRNGHLHLFEENVKEVYEHRHTLRLVHGRIGCSVLQLEQPPQSTSSSSQTSSNTVGLVTAGHDGTVKRITLDLSTKQLACRHTLHTPVTWITSVQVDSGLVTGFNAKQFVVWNWRRRELVTEIECGGGHRSAAVYCPSDSNEGDFVFLRNKSTHWIRFGRDTVGFGQREVNNWHSMSCTTVAVIPSALTTLVVSGGDDNLVKIHRLDGTNALQYLDEIGTHVSSVKSVIVDTIVADRSWRIFSAGGRAQVCVSEVELCDDEVRVTAVADFMLHQTDAQRMRSGTANVINSAAETRFMCVALSGGSDLFGACSDGFIRQLRWTAGSGIQLVGQLFYGRCVLKVTLVAGYLVTAATDGKICFWKLEDGTLGASTEETAVIVHHESGIQSWDWATLSSPNTYQVVTGGDDQRVVLSHIQVVPTVRLIRTQRLEDVHTAQVNGVTFAKDAIYTTGTDQTVFRWNQHGKQPQQVAQSCVADIKGICMLSTQAAGERTVLVYGHGVQTMSV